ncbi:MAG: phosphoribosylanthranilate isomerase [Pseudomonadota bacterium]
MTQVKICGLKEPETLRTAVQAGAEWIGFMLYDKSPRAVTPAAVSTLLLGIGNSVPVAVMVDPDDALIDQVAAMGIRTFQLHGGETPERIQTIKQRTDAEIWKALGVSSAEDLKNTVNYSGSADRLLLDAKPPKGAENSGGLGEAFDWTLLKDWDAPLPWLLAGGLDAGNVREAIQITGATAVDVSSGVERARGLKDSALIKDFITAAKSAAKVDHT